MSDWEWMTASAMAKHLGISHQRFNQMVEENGWRMPERKFLQGNRQGIWRPARKGPGFEYHYFLLPSRTQAALIRKHRAPAPEQPRAESKRRLSAEEAWKRFEALPDTRKDKARSRLKVLLDVDALVRGGTPKEVAIQLICAPARIPARTFYEWEARVHGVERPDWLPNLVDHYAGRTATAEVTAEAWDFFLAHYLTQSRQPLATSWTKTREMGAEKDWTVPSLKTFERKLVREIPAEVIVLKREGEEAVSRMFPAQRRDRSSLHALEAVNFDGHTFDVFCLWPDGTIGRPVACVFQDLYSGKILSWRIARSENTASFRLAFGDMVEAYGIPDHAVIDNTRTAANKWMTGGVPNRFRFKVKADDPKGLFPILGVEVHWTQPYHGQSKPIERAFGDLCNTVARSPACEGAYTGNKPTDKPENYGSKAIPIADFIAHVDREIRAHNARPGRESKVCGGRLSFDEAFAASYAAAPIRKGTEAQREQWRRLWLLSSEAVTARKPDGHVELDENRYWAPELVRHIGAKLVVRFDPDNLRQPVIVYRLDGSMICTAEAIDDTGYFDKTESKAMAKTRGDFRKGTKLIADATLRMSAARAARIAAEADPVDEALPEAKIVRGTFGNLALKPVPADGIDPEARGQTFNFEDFGRGVALLRRSEE